MQATSEENTASWQEAEMPGVAVVVAGGHLVMASLKLTGQREEDQHQVGGEANVNVDDQGDPEMASQMERNKSKGGGSRAQTARASTGADNTSTLVSGDVVEVAAAKKIDSSPDHAKLERDFKEQPGFCEALFSTVNVTWWECEETMKIYKECFDAHARYPTATGHQLMKAFNAAFTGFVQASETLNVHSPEHSRVFIRSVLRAAKTELARQIKKPQAAATVPAESVQAVIYSHLKRLCETPDDETQKFLPLIESALKYFASICDIPVDLITNIHWTNKNLTLDSPLLRLGILLNHVWAASPIPDMSLDHEIYALSLNSFMTGNFLTQQALEAELGRGECSTDPTHRVDLRLHLNAMKILQCVAKVCGMSDLNTILAPAAELRVRALQILGDPIVQFTDEDKMNNMVFDTFVAGTVDADLLCAACRRAFQAGRIRTLSPEHFSVIIASLEGRDMRVSQGIASAADAAAWNKIKQFGSAVRRLGELVSFVDDKERATAKPQRSTTKAKDEATATSMRGSAGVEHPNSASKRHATTNMTHVTTQDLRAHPKVAAPDGGCTTAERAEDQTTAEHQTTGGTGEVCPGRIQFVCYTTPLGDLD